LSLLLAQDSTEKDDRRKKHDEAVQQLTADMQAYEKMANLGHDRELFAIDKTTISRFLTLDTNIVRMASADDADSTTVRLMVNSASQQAFYAAKHAMESHVKWLTAKADEAGNNAIQIYHQAIKVTKVLWKSIRLLEKLIPSLSIMPLWSSRLPPQRVTCRKKRTGCAIWSRFSICLEKTFGGRSKAGLLRRFRRPAQQFGIVERKAMIARTYALPVL